MIGTYQFAIRTVQQYDTGCIFIISYLDWYADYAEEEVGEGEAGEEHVGGRLHLAAAQDGQDDQEVASHAK